jgi:SAM-dependent methyltransferase
MIQRYKRTVLRLTLCASLTLISFLYIFTYVNTAEQNGIGLKIGPASAQQPGQQKSRIPDVPYVPTPPEVVAEMLRLANVKADDVVYDRGCGDGRIVITAVKEYGARGVGIDIDPERIKESNENARKAGVAERVTFKVQDLFETDLSRATVVTLYLLPEINLKLRPKLLRELKPGTRIVSHSFDMGDWKPERVVKVNAGGVERTIYYWTMPAKGLAGK